MKYLTSLLAVALLALGIPSLALATGNGAGVGVGVTAGTYNASAQSGAVSGAIIFSANIGTVRWTSGSGSYASAGMAIDTYGASQTDVIDDGINNITTTHTYYGGASIKGFGEAQSVSFVEYAGDGAFLGISGGIAASTGNANSNGAFLGVGVIAATASHL